MDALPAEDDSSWPREGACRIVQGGKWRRKNGPVACDMCRKRRVRCSGYETGAPCDSCRRRQCECVVGADTYAHTASEQTPLFVPILPPPIPPCSSPSASDSVEALADPLDLTALVEALKDSVPRPAPLVWKASPDDIRLSQSGTTTRSRAPPSPTKRSGAVDSDEEDEAVPPPTPSGSKRRKLGQAPFVFSPEPEPAAFVHAQPDQIVFEAALALFGLRGGSGSGQLVSLEGWKASGMVERRGTVEEEGRRKASSSHLSGFALSSTRDEPLPAPPHAAPYLFPPPFVAELAAAPYPLHLLTSGASLSRSASGSRRASLISSVSSLESGTTAPTSIEWEGEDSEAAKGG
ncbi:hypothetical protein JCM8097_002602 [Rhodosporidiobolus ruineniae]